MRRSRLLWVTFIVHVVFASAIFYEVHFCARLVFYIHPDFLVIIRIFVDCEAEVADHTHLRKWCLQDMLISFMYSMNEYEIFSFLLKLLHKNFRRKNKVVNKNFYIK